MWSCTWCAFCILRALGTTECLGTKKFLSVGGRFIWLKRPAHDWNGGRWLVDNGLRTVLTFFLLKIELKDCFSNKWCYLVYSIVLLRNPTIKCDKQVLLFCLGLYMLGRLGSHLSSELSGNIIPWSSSRIKMSLWKSLIFKRLWMWEWRETVALR